MSRGPVETIAGPAMRPHVKGTKPVAHFPNRLVFCLFAADVRLLSGKLFRLMPDASRKRPALF